MKNLLTMTIQEIKKGLDLCSYGLSQPEDWHSVRNAIKELEKYELLLESLSAFIGQSGEYDGFLSCCIRSVSTHEYCQIGDVVKDVDDLLDWYKGICDKEIDR